MDTKLYEADVQAFGSPTDIDQNGHIVVLMTPTVNKLTTASECKTIGYITGFFYGLDLTPSAGSSNKGEIFYSMVADPNGATGSCAHSVAEFDRQVPATFIHELQHMISYGQHVLVRGGADEELWLNEGLSHIAEELGSLLYENDPSQPRSTPSQIFPDSSQGFIGGDFRNAFTYLRNSMNTSVTLSLAGRHAGGTWRCLALPALAGRPQGSVHLSPAGGDAPHRRRERRGQGGGAVRATVRRLRGGRLRVRPDQRRAFGGRWTIATGSCRATCVGFSSASTTWASRRGTTRSTAHSRSSPRRLPVDAITFGSMVPGTMAFYELNTGATPRATIQFSPATGTSFAPELEAQVTILRLPLTP